MLSVREHNALTFQGLNSVVNKSNTRTQHRKNSLNKPRHKLPIQLNPSLLVSPDTIEFSITCAYKLKDDGTLLITKMFHLYHSPSTRF